MGEEALPFTMILCPLFVAVGYDSVIAVLVTYVATQIGFQFILDESRSLRACRVLQVLTYSPVQDSVCNKFVLQHFRLWNDYVLCIKD